ncbi:MAG: TolC family protein [Candidatus Melainabacteria bacterium]|nr:TolC family protein [Candidatus Melainabacteria bacterium]
MLAKKRSPEKRLPGKLLPDALLCLGLCVLLTGGAGAESLQPLEAAANREPSAIPAEVTVEQAASTVVSTERVAATPLLVVELSKTETFPIDPAVVVQLVESQSLPVQREQWGVSLSKTRFWQSVTDALPDVSATHQQSRFQGGIQIFGGNTINVYRSTVQPQVNAQWTVHPGGKDVFEALAARQRVKGAREQLRETFQTQLSEALIAYYNLLEAVNQQSIVTQALADAEAQSALGKARAEAGVGTKLQWMQADTFRAQQELSFIEAENAVAKAEALLVNRLNLERWVHVVPAAETVMPRRLVSGDMTEAQMVLTALQKHPTLGKLLPQIQALKNDLRAIRSEYIPSVTLSGYLNRTGPRLANLVESRFGGYTVQWNLLNNMGFDIPLRAREQKQLLEQKRVEQQEAIRLVEQQVVQAYLESRAAERQMAVAQQAVSLAEESYRLADGRLRTGIGINLDVIAAQTDRVKAKAAYNTAVLGFNRAQIRLLQAMGVASPENLLTGYKSTSTTPVTATTASTRPGGGVSTPLTHPQPTGKPAP